MKLVALSLQSLCQEINLKKAFPALNSCCETSNAPAFDTVTVFTGRNMTLNSQ